MRHGDLLITTLLAVIRPGGWNLPDHATEFWRKKITIRGHNVNGPAGAASDRPPPLSIEVDFTLKRLT